MKRRYLLYCFTAIIYIVTIISFIDKDKIFSEFENRNLKTNVRFSINKFVNGSFQEEYEEYINDQFPLRNQWISIKSLNEYLLGKIENNGIIYGENKWLFEKFTSLNKVKLSNNINAINQFSKKYDKSVSVMIVPNSYEIYNEDLPRGLYQIEQEKIIKDLYSNLIYSNNINLLDKFKNEKNNYIYYKTDHHWTTYGAYLAYCSFIESIGMKPINLNYYNSNAAVFSETTKNVDFSEVQQIFTKHLSPDASILDFGCGSGRDTKYFLNNGYHVTATDGSGVICKMATDYTGIKVKQMLFEELDDRNQYDGIWACASVLHLSREKLPNIFHKMHQALKTNGIIYTSFKYGTFEGERNGRYFTDFTEVMFEKFAKQISGLQIEKMWITGDVREGRGDERWLNILLRKTDVC